MAGIDTAAGLRRVALLALAAGTAIAGVAAVVALLNGSLGPGDGRVIAASVAAPPLALAPALTRLLPLFNDKQRLALLLNIGPLHQPTSREQFLTRAADLPDKLFSHNDQQSEWQSYGAEGSTTGWGGLIGDAGVAMNATTSLTCVNLAGNAVYLAGKGPSAGQFMVDPHGPVPLLVNDAAELGRFIRANSRASQCPRGATRSGRHGRICRA